MNTNVTRLAGSFWIVGEESRAFEGELTYDEFGSITLVVNGEYKQLASVFDRTGNYNVQGNCGGKNVSLFDCFLTKTSHIPQSAEIIVNSALVGLSVGSLDDQIIDYVEVFFDHLDSWLNLKGFREEIRSIESITIKYRKRSTKPVHLKDSELNFSTKPTLSTNELSGRREFGDSHFLQLKFVTPKSLNDVYASTAVWADYLSFAMRRPIVSPRMIVRHESKDGLLLTPVYPNETQKGRHLFQMRNLKGWSATSFKKWEQNYPALQPVISLLTGTYFQPRLHLAALFLAYAQALEGLQRLTRPSATLMPKKDFDSLKRDMKKLVPDDLSSRDSLIAKFSYLNDWTLAERLKDLYSSEVVVLSRLFPEPADFVNIKNVRNYLTHPSKPNSRRYKCLMSRDFLILTRKLKVALEILLLSQLGNATKSRSIVECDSEYRWLSKETHKPFPK